MKSNYNRNTDEYSNNLSTTSINNCKTTIYQNYVIRTTETSNCNDVISDDLAAPTRKNEFPINTIPFKLDLNETEFNKRKKILSNNSPT